MPGSYRAGREVGKRADGTVGLVTVLESVYDDMGDTGGPVLALKPRCAAVPPGVFLPID
jgi:hypothetical protein